MVYCTKCGVKNEDNVNICSKCGAPLQMPSSPRKKHRSDSECFGSGGRRKEEGCFGIPYGGAVVGLIFGAIIVIIGLAILSGLQWDVIWGLLWPLIVIIFGLLIVVGALFGMRRRF